MSNSEDRIAGLQRELEELSRPRLAKPTPPNFRELCQQKARQALERALQEFPSHSEAARVMDINERTLRDALEGAGRRNVPLWFFYALSREARIALVSDLLAAIPPEVEDDDEARSA